MDLKELGNVTFSNEAQFLKADKPINLTFSGIDICLSDEQFANVNSFISSKSGGSSICTKDLQSLNAESPIDVTDDGISSRRSEEHPMKARL